MTKREVMKVRTDFYCVIQPDGAFCTWSMGRSRRASWWAFLYGMGYSATDARIVELEALLSELEWGRREQRLRATLKEAIADLGAELGMLTNAMPARRTETTWAAFRKIEGLLDGTAEKSPSLDTAMAELCARLREHYEAAGHPTCPDPECGEMDGQHAPGCAYLAYVQAQDLAIEGRKSESTIT